MSEWLPHGGEVDAIAERCGIPRDQWLDLSTGINPNPYPLPDLAREYWHRLPDASLDGWLREAAAACYGAPDPASVVPAPGSQSIIQWLPRLVAGGSKVAVVGPTYREHAACWRSADHRVLEVATPDDVPDDTGVVVVGNPNNPDGRMHDPERLLHLGRGRLLVVDEAFADVAPEISLAPCAGARDLIVLRSFGKFFGLAGMRLGFALAGEPMAGRLRRAFGPWAVAGPAAAVGAVALADDGWIRQARVRLTAASGRLDGLLMRTGLGVAGGTTLFRLVDHARAGEIFDMLLPAGILVRTFADLPRWIRIGIPGDDAGFERLGAALAAWRPQAVSSMSVPSAPRARASGSGRPTGTESA